MCVSSKYLAVWCWVSAQCKLRAQPATTSIWLNGNQHQHHHCCSSCWWPRRLRQVGQRGRGSQGPPPASLHLTMHSRCCRALIFVAAHITIRHWAVGFVWGASPSIYWSTVEFQWWSSSVLSYLTGGDDDDCDSTVPAGMLAKNRTDQFRLCENNST